MNAFLLGDISTLIYSLGHYLVTNIGMPVIMLLGGVAVIFGFWMLFRAITSRQGQSGPRWLSSAVALVIGFGMIFSASFYKKVGTVTNDSVTNAVTSKGNAQDTLNGDTIFLPTNVVEFK